MKKYLIDGRFLASMSTGVDRYAFQILKELDKLVAGKDISILVPSNAKEIPEYKNIKVIKSTKMRFWTQVVFGTYALFHGMIPINFCNEASFIAPKGIVCLHDVCYAETTEFFPFVNDYPEDEIKWFKKAYRRICKKAFRIVTVSEFSKCRIMELLGVEEDRITVIGNGWQHFENVKTDDNLMMNYPQLQSKNYYFTVTSPNRNKNIDWILQASRANPEEIFVVSGKNLDKIVDFKKYPNVIYVGFAKDELIKTLMSNCKAFIFPSYYEGFGIPPLEALSTGAQIIISDVASLPEIFGDTAHYIQPDVVYGNLKELLNEKVESPDRVLSTYSWSNAAKKFADILV